MAEKIKLDIAGFEAAQTTSKQMITDYSTLRANQVKYEEAFFMDWTDKPGGNIALTISPDPHNKVRGATRLLTATAPKFNVPAEKNNPDAADKSSLCEKAANAMWAGSNAVQGIVAERDMAHSATLYGEMHMRVISTKDMLEAAQEAAKENKDKDKQPLFDANVKHYEEIRKRTPYLFEPLEATTCYVRRSRAGLEAHYQKVKVTVADVLAAYGGAAEQVLKGKKPYENVELNVFYDRANVYVWTGGDKEPILAGPHGLSTIPVAYYSPEGSSVYKKPERAILPFLYPVIASGVWNRLNLFLTVTATNAKALMNAQFVHKQSTPDSKVTVDHSVIAGVLQVPAGDEFGPMAKEIVNQGLVQQYQMYDGLMDESTIFDQTLGQPISGGNATFSATALLHQSGRLPLTPIQEGLAALFADVMSIAFRWWKIDGKAALSTKTGENIELDPKQIPEVLNFKVTVDVDLPQDKMQQATTGATIVQSGLASKEWTRDNILSIGQSDMEQKKIWKEQMADMAAQTLFPVFMQQMAQKMGLMPPTQPGGPVDPNAPQGQPTGPSPEQIAQMQAAMQGQGQGGQIPAGMGDAGPTIESPIAPTSPIPSGMNPGGM
jgi:hypothetical protein